MMDKDQLISVAKILGFHGISGELRAGFTKGHERKLHGLGSAFIEIDDKFKEFVVQSIRFHKKNLLIKFKEINSINEAEKYKNSFIYVSKEYMAKSLENDEFFITDLIGMAAFNKNDELIGYICEVSDNGATDILSIESVKEKNKHFLVPFVKDLVPELDIKNKKILINDIEGLLQ